MHCESAPCIKAAANGEIYRRPDGIVIVDPVKSKGRKNLVNACPYGAIQWNEKQDLPQKCTLCAHLLDGGWEKSRCVQSCPTGALSMIHAEDDEMEKIAASERLEPYRRELGTKPFVYYKNLYRFTRCFIGGSISTSLAGVDECVEAAVVTLFNSANDKIDETTSDAFGDFKFDNLEQNSGIYTISITHRGHTPTTVKVDLKESISVSTIVLD
jgi:ferredoxin